MATLKNIKKAKGTAAAAKPFGAPADDDRFEILIPAGAASGRIPASDQYIGKLATLVQNVSRGGQGNPQYVFGFEIVKGPYKGMDFNLYCPHVEKALWKLTETLAALGVPTEPGKKVSFSRRELLGTLVRMNIKDDVQGDSGREVSKLVGVLPHPDGAGKKAKSKGFQPDDEEEEEEQPEEEEQDEEEETEDEDESEAGDDDDEDDEEEDEETEDKEDEEDEDEDEEGDDWSKEMSQEADKPRRGRPPVKRDDVYDEPTVRRRGPKVEERPVKKAKRGRPRR